MFSLPSCDNRSPQKNPNAAICNTKIREILLEEQVQNEKSKFSECSHYLHKLLNLPHINN